LRQQQEAYKVEGVDETEAAHPRDRKKRKQSQDAVRAAAFRSFGIEANQRYFSSLDH
jgi:hypothetical protein